MTQSTDVFEQETPAQGKNTLQTLLIKSKRRKLIQHALQCSPLLMLIAVVLAVVFVEPSAVRPATAILIILMAVSVCAVCAFYRPSYRAITLSNLAKDLNRRFPLLEESCELLLESTQENLTVLQRLQYQRTAHALSQLHGNAQVDLVPRYPLKTALMANLITALVCLSVWYFLWDVKQMQNAPNASVPSIVDKNDEHRPTAMAQLIDANITVDPPSYALGIHGYQSNQPQPLDAQILAGSEVHWQLTFSSQSSPQSQHYSLQMSDENLPLTRLPDGRYTLSKVIHRSSVYQILDHQQRIIALHSIKVIADTPPKIVFLMPQATITEIQTKSESTEPTLNTQVQISDDFGLSKVEILASVAKGSGEAVKFRDSVFTFDALSTVDNTDNVDGMQLYSKKWNLTALDMEPGDELYFSVKAWDNREAQPQLTQSSTKIIRWLDEDVESVFSEGTVIDNMPAYFKSQRQIIIDTKALIARRDQSSLRGKLGSNDKVDLGDKHRQHSALTEQEFNQTSQALGVAQADLKHKYGQFVGDEVSGITRSMEDGDSQHQDEKHDSHDEDEEHEQHDEDGEHAAEGHAAHQHEGEHDSSDDKSGHQTAIEQFGHAHGETDVAIFKTQGGIEQNPRVMMKRAIGYMWQAESQLRLNRPQDALPYEEQALIWLNRAKKAERIYVKRLGFEPPPVTEKRRYQGELADIKNNVLHIPIIENETDIRTLNQAILILNAALKPNIAFSPEEQDTLHKVDALLNTLLETNPEVIEALGALAQIQSSNQRVPRQCHSCVDTLIAQLWRLLPPARYQAQQPARRYTNTQPAIKQFTQFRLEQQSQ
jgi:hypothetical protein